MPTDTTKPLLSIKTVIERPFIEIDDRRFEVRTRRDMGPEQLAKLAKLQKSIEESGLEVGQSEDDWFRMSAVLGEAVRLMLIDIPEEQLAKLSILDRVELFSAFNEAVGLQTLAATTTAPSSPPPTKRR